jgi:hypothetical protein
MVRFRLATPEDIPWLRGLIEQSVRALSVPYYTGPQIESALRYVFGPDTQLIADRTYYVIESDEGEVVAAGGWSRRRSAVGPAHGQYTPGESTVFRRPTVAS